MLKQNPMIEYLMVFVFMLILVNTAESATAEGELQPRIGVASAISAILVIGNQRLAAVV